MEITTGAVSTLLPKLSGLVNDEYKLQKSVRGEIMFLEAELEAMQAALRLMISSASIDQPPNMQDKLWARDVRELSYDLEDNIDKFLVRIDHAPEHLHGLRAFIDRSLNLLTKAGIRHNIGTDIKVIKTRIRELSERHDRYKIDIVTAKPTRPSVDRLRLIALHKKATELIGTEEKANDLVKMLMEEEGSNQQLKIISIVGIGGLGKTTLANVVYQKLERQFDCGAFVTVSHDPKMDQIFKSMLYQINRDMYRNINGETWDETLLINELRNLLTNRRYFIVIDDIWNKSVLGNIMCALNRTGRGSRIIITTRILDVAEQTGSVYILEPLSSEDSRKLFYLRIFGTEERCLPKELAKESENILRKCGGVPLAIITIGGVLASKKENENTCKYWSKVYKSMGSGLENNSDDVTNMRSILSVSYYDLPLHLRTCFLYLTLYPEDYNISTPDLIWKWIGEGFVPQKPGMGMYEVGEDYICELINRSLIQPSHIDIHNKLSICRIHDMVLDLITFLSNEEHFLSKLGVQQAQSIRSKLRRLTLQTKNQEFINKELEKTTVSHVRSLIVFSGALNLLPALSRFPVLRVLDLKQAQVGNDHFKDICNLFHLRYLALRRNCITEIPKEIGNLKFLQVLDINGTEIVKLPSSFVQLRQLVYLNFKSLVTIPDWFGYLKSLQELIGYIHLTSPAMLRIFSELTELRHVGLYFNKWDESYEKPFLSWLSSSVSLKYLTINGEVNIELGSRCDKLSPGPQQLQEINIYSAICSVPRWMSSLLSLAVLDISLMTLEEEDLQILGTLPSLYQLAISLKEPTLGRDKKLVVINAHLFLCLKRFELYKSTGVVFAQGAMENLQWLELSFGVRETIDHLGHFILGLGNLSSLKHVMVGLDYQKAKPEDVETAKAAIQTEIEMNPNNPRLCIGPMVVLKVNIQSKEIENKIIKIISTVEGVYGISTDPKEGKVTVLGFVSAHSVEKKLREAVGTAEIVELHWPRMS